MMSVSLALLLGAKGSGKTFFLYKIVSEENWQASQKKKQLVLPAEDEKFIHLAEEAQLKKIIQKCWKDKSSFYLLKISPQKLKGKLVKEKNPGGNTEYYHLYNGSIPLSAVIKAEHIKQADLVLSKY